MTIPVDNLNLILLFFLSDATICPLFHSKPHCVPIVQHKSILIILIENEIFFPTCLLSSQSLYFLYILTPTGEGPMAISLVLRLGVHCGRVALPYFLNFVNSGQKILFLVIHKDQVRHPRDLLVIGISKLLFCVLQIGQDYFYFLSTGFRILWYSIVYSNAQ